MQANVEPRSKTLDFKSPWMVGSNTVWVNFNFHLWSSYARTIVFPAIICAEQSTYILSFRFVLCACSRILRLIALGEEDL